MRARLWPIAATCHAPTEYDIPSLPEWHVSRTEKGLAFAEDAEETPFITAERPVRVRR